MNNVMNRMCGGALCYGGLAACHGHAALATGKWEVYVPMFVLYAVMCARGGH